MRSRAVDSLSIILIVFILSISTGCRKDVQEPDIHPMNVSNLIVNGDFSQWDEHDVLLKSWNTVAAEKGIISKVKGLSISGNVPGSFYVYQTVEINEGKFYKATISADYTINNYFSAGLYIMDSTLHTVLGKFERTYSSGAADVWAVVFYAPQHAHIALTLGFLSGIDASTHFTNASLQEYDYQPILAGSPFADHLDQLFSLDFTPQQFDSTVSNVADYVNSVLLCRRTYYSDTVELPLLHSMIGSDPNYSYFNGYRDSLDQVNIGYCQKSSLSLSEILTNEFHIPTRQVHMVFGTEGKHQFTEYWNPFAAKWIAIDPCFNTRYIKNNVLLSVEEFDRSQATTYMTPFGTHFFYSLAPEDLPWYWQNMDDLMITDYYTITYPYTL